MIDHIFDGANKTIGDYQLRTKRGVTNIFMNGSFDLMLKSEQYTGEFLLVRPNNVPVLGGTKWLTFLMKRDFITIDRPF
ncbi:hypothetical protein GCM10028825_06030 [Spirosoma agri]